MTVASPVHNPIIFDPALNEAGAAYLPLHGTQWGHYWVVVVGRGVFVADCYSPWQAVECSEDGFWGLVELLVLALVANQATYQIAVAPRGELEPMP